MGELNLVLFRTVTKRILNKNSLQVASRSGEKINYQIWSGRIEYKDITTRKLDKFYKTVFRIGLIVFRSYPSPWCRRFATPIV